jgi:hypothetical protein
MKRGGKKLLIRKDVHSACLQVVEQQGIYMFYWATEDMGMGGMATRPASSCCSLTPPNYPGPRPIST